MLQLNVYKGFGQQAGTLNPTNLVPLDSPPATAKTFQFGNRIWIGVVTAKTTMPMTHGEIYSYDVKLKKADNSTADLRSEGLLNETDVNGREQLPIGYSVDTLPTFVLSDPRVDKLKIAQVSCRKIHGHGFDALAQLDKKIKEDGGDDDPEKRPQQLFMTGDQLYADDVPMAVLHHINMLDDVSIGFGEKVRLDGPSGVTQSDPSIWAPGLRQGLLYNVARMTSGAAGSHVLSYSEYARLYLMYWSNRAWNKPLYDVIKPLMTNNEKSKLKAAARDFVKPVPFSVTDNDSLHAKYRTMRRSASTLWQEGLTAKQKTQHIGIDIDPAFDVTKEMDEPEKNAADGEHYKYFLRKTYLKVFKELKDTVMFVKSLPNVSRLLANVPSYMIFDDHEITDDWYLSKRWRLQVLKKELGKDILRNGLMAYAIFQDWGNVPDEYVPEAPQGGDTSPITKRTELLRKSIEYCGDLKNSEDRPAVADEIDMLLGIQQVAESQVKWHFNVRTGDTRTFVLDTRTRREFDSLDAPPVLLSSDAIDEQLPLPHPDGASTPFTFVVSAAPAPGMQSIEQLAQPLYASYYGMKAKVEHNDLTDDDVGIVHGFAGADYEAWGFSVKGLESLLDRLANYKSVILFSGDVHYGFSSVVDYWKGTSTTPRARILTFTSSSAKNEDAGKWNLVNTAFVQRLMTGIGNNMEKVGWKNRVLSITGPATLANRLRLRENPAVVPVNGWVPGSTVNRQPDFRWRFRVLTDKNPHEDDPLSSDVDLSTDAGRQSAYETITVRHRDSFISGVYRRMTFRSNVGLLSFETSGSTVSAVHEYFFVAGSRDASNDKAKSHIKHKIEIVAPSGERLRPVLP